jgi:hypothetical protein
LLKLRNWRNRPDVPYRRVEFIMGSGFDLFGPDPKMVQKELRGRKSKWEEIYAPTTKERTWKTNGKEIPIRELHDTHLIAAYKTLIRRGFVEMKMVEYYLGVSPPLTPRLRREFERMREECRKRKPSKLMDWLREELEYREIPVPKI